ncbi:MAG: hypothetical protein N2557_01370 [Hydrogenophilus sp.]|nr:hypothetical protein [Hydrogenophilus sp.]
MAILIAIIGNKGGTGKTTLSHLLCHGLGLLGQKSACIITDTAREPLTPEGRRYVIADARSPAMLERIVGKLRSLNDWVGVIDGGGNRPEMDKRLYALSDLVLLPFRESAEDIRTVIRDLEQFPRAYAVPSQWPLNNQWQKQAADKLVAQMMAPYRDRILKPVPALSATKLLLLKQIPNTLPTPLNNAARQFARQMIELLDLSDGIIDSEDDENDYRIPDEEIPLRYRR